MSEMPDCITVATVKSRKTHRCCECRKDISAGTDYVKTSGIWSGRPAAYKTCLECDALVSKAMKFNRDGGGHDEEGPWYGGLFEWLQECGLTLDEFRAL